MNTGAIVKLFEEWHAFTGVSSNESLPDFATWLLAKEAYSTPNSESEDLKFKLLELSRAMELTIKPVLRESDLDLDTLRILTIIQKLGRPCRHDVVVMSMMGTSTGFHLLKVLETKGMIKGTQDPVDRRAAVLSLTSKGRAVLKNKRKQLKKFSLLSGLKLEADRKVFIKTLNVLHKFHVSKILNN